jgi:signal transduction histidine kinase
MPSRGAVAYRAVVGSLAIRPRDLWVPGDALIALGAGVVQIVGTVLAARHQPDAEPLDAAAYALIAAGSASLAVRRRWPVLVLVAAFAATFGYNWLGYPGGPVWISLIVAFFTVVASGRRVAAYTALAAGYVLGVWLEPLAHDKPGPSLVQALGLAAWLLALAAVSEVVRYRRQLREAARRQAVEVRRGELEATRRRASEERLDIARELHDVLAHGISMINVQAGVALELMDEQPEQARTALATIKQASKDALVEVQAVLGALRQSGEPAATAPTPSIANLDRLLGGARSAGLQVQAQVMGEPRVLPVGVDLAAYRILQESLTNVVRHAGASSVTVAVTYGPHELTVEVVDDGRSGSSNGNGSGIAGMRERAIALGGELDAGRRLGGGFRVHALLPLPGGTA